MGIPGDEGRWVRGQVLTCENSGHEGGEHEEQHGEEEEARVTQDLLGFIPDPQVEQANKEADSNVGGDPQVRQDLGTGTVLTHMLEILELGSDMRRRRPRASGVLRLLLQKNKPQP